MKNKGVLYANESKKHRADALSSELQRLGVKNTIICSHNEIELPTYIGRNSADRVLFDCASHDSIDLQARKALLDAAIIMVNHASKSGGYIVYSTDSPAFDENECIIDHVLRKRHVIPVDLGFEAGIPGFTTYRSVKVNSRIENSRRFYPHIHNMNPRFVCKLRKINP